MIKKYIDYLAKLVVDNKYSSIGIVLLILVIGIWAFTNLDIEAYPDFAAPKVQIITQMPGKSAEDIERLVTIPLEKEFNGIPFEDKLYSTSIFGLSVIHVVFEEGLTSNVIRQQVLERIYQADLPPNVKPMLGPDSSPIGEIYRYTVESKYYNQMSLKAIEDWQIEKAFKQIPGIINVNSFGGPIKTYKVLLDLGKIRYYDIDISDIFDAIAQSNSTTGGHYIDVNSQAFIVRGIGLMKDAKSIEEVVIKNIDGVPLKVKDVATIVIGPPIRLGQVGKNYNDDAIEGIVLMRKGANPTETIKSLNKRLPALKANLPNGVKIIPFYERQQLVDKTVETIGHNILLGIAFVIIVLFAFTLNYQVTLIASLVIPLSILFAFIMFNFFSIPANLLSLGAVDFGIIADGAIILVENIYRHLSKCKSELTDKEKADMILCSVKEVSDVIVFSTFIILICFLPLLSFDGVAGKLFHPLTFTMGFTLIGAVLVSLFVIPSFCLIFFPNRVEEKHNSRLEQLARLYRTKLNKSLRNPKPILKLVLILFVISILMFTKIGSEFMPNLDEGNIWLRVTILPRSTTIEHSVKIARRIREIVLQYPEVKTVVSHIGSPDDGTDHNLLSNIENLIDLKPANKWRFKFHKNKEKLIQDMSKSLEEIPGITTYFTQYIQDNVEEAVSGSKGQVVVKIYGKDLFELQRLQDECLKVLNSINGVVDLSADKVLGQPQYQIQVDREKAARYGLNVDAIQNIIEIAVGGKNATELIDGEKRFNVFIRLKEENRNSKNKLENILVKSSNGVFVPLENLTRVEQKNGAMIINRVDNQRCSIVRFNVRGRDLGSTVEEGSEALKSKIQLPDEYRIVWAGQSESQKHANIKLLLILPVTLFMVAVVLHMQFKSWVYVMIAMSCIIVTFIGGVFALFLTRTYFSISAGVGFIAAIGVSIQNGVIILSSIRNYQTEYTNKCRVLTRASLIKLRPVLTASSVAILGLLPAAISNGIGAQSQKPFAITIIGALISGTIFSVFLIPVLFNIFIYNKTNLMEKNNA